MPDHSRKVQPRDATRQVATKRHTSSPLFLRCVGKCQVIALDSCVRPPEAVLSSFSGLMRDVLGASHPSERLLLGSFLAKALGLIGAEAKIARQPLFHTLCTDLSRAFQNPPLSDNLNGAVSTVTGETCDGARVCERALRLVEQKHTDSSLTLRNVARDLGCSPWHLSRLMVRYTKMGFREHLRLKRVASAQLLMTDPALRLKEVAYLAGFNDAAALSHQFRAVTGLMPSAYRRRLHETPRTADTWRARYRKGSHLTTTKPCCVTPLG
jgi:AraC-like DNA-binding protein